jgi:hypothetical protein
VIFEVQRHGYCDSENIGKRQNWSLGATEATHVDWLTQNHSEHAFGHHSHKIDEIVYLRVIVSSY